MLVSLMFLGSIDGISRPKCLIDYGVVDKCCGQEIRMKYLILINAYDWFDWMSGFYS